jgi:hypothetical protein
MRTVRITSLPRRREPGDFSPATRKKPARS